MPKVPTVAHFRIVTIKNPASPKSGISCSALFDCMTGGRGSKSKRSVRQGQILSVGKLAFLPAI